MYPVKDTDFAEFNTVLERKNIPLNLVKRGDVLTFGEVKIEFLHPISDERLNSNWDNNNSIVLRIIYGETSFLMTGDIEKEAEKELLQMPDFLQANVIKVAHHGSRTSSTTDFIRLTKAKLAIISVGKHSPFGHPHEEVVERWKDIEAKTITTGENGTITVSSDGKNLSVKTFLEKQIYR